MANTPKSVKVDLDTEQIEKIREEGRLEGVQQGRVEILNWLEAKYIGPDQPDRGTPEANAILVLAREASDYLKKLRKV